MIKKQILIVGFGNMGCRHVQALLNDKDKYDLHVVEPSKETVENNIGRIGATLEDCKWYNSINDLPFIDLAVIATSSAPRFNIVKTLINKGIKYFLLEKIVFQSVNQFNEILKLLNENNGRAYCNFVNRYFPVYNEIKGNMAKQEGIEMIVYGNAFGLGCNAIHYIDIFQYLTGSDEIKIFDSELVTSDSANRRGDEYKEFTGTIKVQNRKKDSLAIISDKEFLGGVMISIRTGKLNYVLNEQTQLFFKIEDNGIIKKRFIMLPTSKLTNIIVSDILKNQCKLTDLESTFRSHNELFDTINKHLTGSTSDSRICPIT